MLIYLNIMINIFCKILLFYSYKFKSKYDYKRCSVRLDTFLKKIFFIHYSLKKIIFITIHLIFMIIILLYDINI